MSTYIRRNNATWRDDEDFGRDQESLVFPIVKDFFGCNSLRQHPDKYYWSDFVETGADGCEIGYEVKTRECYSTADILRNEGMVINSKKLWLNNFIIFNFWDKIYYYRVKEEQVKTFTRTKFQRDPRSCGHENKSDDVTYIPFDVLLLMHTWNPEREHHEVKSRTDGAEQRRGRCLIDVSSLV